MRAVVPALRWALLGLVLLGAAGWGGTAAWRHLLDDPGPLPQARAIVVPHGNLAEIAGALSDAGAIDPGWRDSHWRFRLAGTLTRGLGEVHAGEFAFPAHASLRTVLAVLRTGQPVQHHVTIPEGLTAPQIITVLSRAEALSGPDIPVPEGSVLPQTYAYTYGTPRAAILARAAAALDRALDEAWARAGFAAGDAARRADPGQHRRARDRQARGAAAGGRGVPQSPARRDAAAIGPHGDLRRQPGRRRAGPSADPRGAGPRRCL
jgi:cell division protein YceG involved in septum cleavage